MKFNQPILLYIVFLSLLIMLYIRKLILPESLGQMRAVWLRQVSSSLTQISLSSSKGRGPRTQQTPAP